jgi:hypothetical protein
LEFRILGPLEVLGDDGPLRLGGAKQRALLALLLLHPGRVVSQERLIDELWGEAPPETARERQGALGQHREQEQEENGRRRDGEEDGVGWADRGGQALVELDRKTAPREVPQDAPHAAGNAERQDGRNEEADVQEREEALTGGRYAG